jgi:hypothetical protein
MTIPCDELGLVLQTTGTQRGTLNAETLVKYRAKVNFGDLVP